MYDLIIIGAGAAGMTASIYARRAELNLVVIEKSAPGGQMITTGEIENYPGSGNITGPELSMNMYNHAEGLGVNFEFNEVVDVKLLDNNVKEVHFVDGTTMQTKALLIATGAIPRTLGVPNEEKFSNRGISWCAICDGPFYKGKKVVFIGGGNSAVDEALYMSGLATEVELVQNLEKLTCDAVTGRKLAEAGNVKIHYNSTVKEFIGDEKLEGVVIIDKDGNEHTIETDGVFEYVGLIPVTDMFKSLNITDKWGYIEANEKMETSAPGVYSAGDVNSKQIRQIVTATNDGAIAVQNILKYLESWE